MQNYPFRIELNGGAHVFCQDASSVNELLHFYKPKGSSAPKMNGVGVREMHASAPAPVKRKVTRRRHKRTVLVRAGTKVGRVLEALITTQKPMSENEIAQATGLTLHSVHFATRNLRYRTKKIQPVGDGRWVVSRKKSATPA